MTEKRPPPADPRPLSRARRRFLALAGLLLATYPLGSWLLTRSAGRGAIAARTERRPPELPLAAADLHAPHDLAG